MQIGKVGHSMESGVSEFRGPQNAESPDSSQRPLLQASSRSDRQWVFQSLKAGVSAAERRYMRMPTQRIAVVASGQRARAATMR